MTVRQAADRWGVSVRRVTALVHQGRVRAVKRGPIWWITQTEKPASLPRGPKRKS